MKKTRIISGTILFIILFVIITFGNTVVMNIATAILGFLAINEYFNAFRKKYRVERLLGDILAISIAFLNFIPKDLIVMIIPTVIMLLFAKLITTDMKFSFAGVAITAFGIFYVLGFLIYIPLLYAEPNSKFLMWYLVIAAWGTDTVAYFVGSKFGKHKLTEISPKKSVEGSIGGIVGAVILSIIYTACLNKFAGLQISYIPVIGIVFLLSILSEIGDLAASSIKRFTGIKDFGNVIPGHGGILDRIDSIIFIAPFAYYWLILL